jgi:HK97 gp10 family phage protein
MEVRWSIPGLAGLEEALSQLPEAVATRVVDGAARKGGNHLRDSIKAEAPVRDDGREKRVSKGSSETRAPGFLKNDIGQRRMTGTRLAAAYAVGASRKAFYGDLREKGSAHQRAEPWLGPAAERAAPGTLRTTTEELAKGLAREARRLMRGVDTRYLTRGR